MALQEFEEGRMLTRVTRFQKDKNPSMDDEIEPYTSVKCPKNAKDVSYLQIKTYIVYQSLFLLTIPLSVLYSSEKCEKSPSNPGNRRIPRIQRRR